MATNGHRVIKIYFMVPYGHWWPIVVSIAEGRYLNARVILFSMQRFFTSISTFSLYEYILRVCVGGWLGGCLTVFLSKISECHFQVSLHTEIKG